MSQWRHHFCRFKAAEPYWGHFLRRGMAWLLFNRSHVSFEIIGVVAASPHPLQIYIRPVMLRPGWAFCRGAQPKQRLQQQLVSRTWFARSLSGRSSPAPTQLYPQSGLVLAYNHSAGYCLRSCGSLCLIGKGLHSKVQPMASLLWVWVNGTLE